MLDARESLPVGVDRTGFRIDTDQPVVPDERHASTFDQTAPKLDESRPDRRSKSRQSCPHSGATVRYTLHSHPLSSEAQDHCGNSLPDILRCLGVHSSKNAHG